MGSSIAGLLLSVLLGVQLISLADAQQKLLVLLQKSGAEQNFKKFFDGIEGNGFELDYRQYNDDSLKLKEFDDWLYSGLMIFTPKATKFGGSINVASILDFIDAGHNVLIAGGSEISDTLRTLAADCGLEVDEKQSAVYDHFNHDPEDELHTTITSRNILPIPTVVGRDTGKPILFRGVAVAVPSDTELAFPVLSASETAYSHDPKKAFPDPSTVPFGDKITLVAALQARNNARVVVSGSVDLFSNKFFREDTGNEEFAVNLALWTFKESGVLTAENLRHHLQGSDGEVGMYRVNDDVEFSIDISEYQKGQWGPYKADDVQVEFVMLNPYIRAPLVNLGNGTFTLAFKVPDVYGVFKYVVKYKKLGYSYINVSYQVPVRPLKHNEFERFIFSAYPYYASALSTMVAFFVMSVVVLYHK